EAGVRIRVTGAFGFSGKYIAQRLLVLQHEVITLTNSLQRPNPFGGSIKVFPYNFSEPHELEKSLRGIDALINTYWVRFDNPPHFTFAQALANSKVLFDAAKRAGVSRVVHISITNPDRKSRLPYFRGKAELEDYLKKTGISYAILRPAVLFGKEDILINNIAWALRRLPVFGIYGSGQYRLQPIYVDDLAVATIDHITRPVNEIIDATGPETYSYCEMVEMIAREIGSRALIVSMPAMLAYQAVRVLGWMVGGVINTSDEVSGLMEEKLYVESPPLGTTRLSDWVRASREEIGRRYASELRRRLNRESGYPYPVSGFFRPPTRAITRLRGNYHADLQRHFRRRLPGRPQAGKDSLRIAIHHTNLAESGIYQIQNANLGALAHDKVWVSCTIILPLRAHGNAGSPVRPVAIGAPAQ